MGGYRYGAATKVEHVHSFDVRAIVRAIRGGPRAQRHPSAAYLRADRLTLHAGGRSMVGAAVTLDGPAETGSLRLAWSYVGRDGQHTQRIALDGQRMPFGGLRWWALCPGCGRRVAKLYDPGSGWYCRRCYGLVYASTCDDALSAAARRMTALRAKLGASGPLVGYLVPPKPEGMHWRTYQRVVGQIREAERRLDRAFVCAVEPLQSRSLRIDCIASEIDRR